MPAPQPGSPPGWPPPATPPGPPSEPPSPRQDRHGRPRRRRPLLVAGVLGAVLLVAVGAWASVTLGWFPPRQGGEGDGSGLAAATTTTLPAPPPAAAGLLPAAVRGPEVEATGWLVADAATGQVLAAREAGKARPMASTTKVMTALLALEAGGDLDRAVTIGAGPPLVGDSSIRLRQGESMTVRQLLQALMLKSANDAAVALAEVVDGSEAKFVEHMNRRAAELDLTETHFASPHGLDRPGHHTSPRDLARLWAVAMRMDAFQDLVGTRTAKLPGGPAELRAITTTNELLGPYPWMAGGKTGFTNLAGRCLVASAERGGRRLVAVALGSPNAFVDVRALLEYGFTSFVRARVADAGETVTVADAEGGWEVDDPVDVLVRKDLLGRLAVAAESAPDADGNLPVRFTAGDQELARATLTPTVAPAAAAAGADAGAGVPTATPGQLDAGPVPAGEAPAPVDPFLAATNARSR